MKNESNEHGDMLSHKRHTLAHLLAASVRKLYPGAQNSIGPAVDNGFYQDFDMGDVTLTEADLPKIEATMKELVKTWTTFEKKEVTKEEALTEFAWNKYKSELINEFAQEGKNLTFYTVGDFVDLCKGGHVDDVAKNIAEDSFKLSKIAGAYWRGDEKNKMLTRVYGLAFNTKEELEAYELMQEEAKKRDHRKLGKDLDLFIFSDTVGKGLPLWTEKGATVRRELERFIVDEEIKRNYKHVYTPDIAKIDLYIKSGHYPYYKESMYAPIQIDEEQYMLRPMTCPHHFELYLSKPRSYRELPMRIAELAKLYRYEQSGELSGLIRVRSFCLADAHIICAGPEQAAEEVNQALNLIEYISSVFGLKMGTNYSYRLSLGDRADGSKYFKDDASWDEAEEKLRQVLKTRNAEFIEAPQEAAFYGPKIDIQMKDVRGKENTAFTVQYDFVMPKRFNLAYTDSTGTEKEPIVVHRSSIGAIERVVAFLIEHFAGNFPLWLAPIQLQIVPIGERQLAYAQEVLKKAKELGIRAQLDDSNDSFGKRVRNAKTEKIPLVAIIGDKEIESNQLTLEGRTEKLGVFAVDEALSMIAKKIKDKAIE
jgi:threonyl-tRNA synthetase